MAHFYEVRAQTTLYDDDNNNAWFLVRTKMNCVLAHFRVLSIFLFIGNRFAAPPHFVTNVFIHFDEIDIFMRILFAAAVFV